MKKAHQFIFTIPVGLLFLTMAAYGILSPWMGYYWDDWSFAWLLHFRGSADFIQAFAPFRPLLGPIFTLTTSLLGEHPFTWQVFALALRFLTGLGVWWSFSKVWPGYKRQVGLLALCFVVFPGYQSQWVALTHSNQELISLAAYLFSFGFTALALRKPDRSAFNTIISLLLMFIGLFPTEYFIGLELLRPLIIWFILAESMGMRQSLVKSLRAWLPYLLLWISNILFLWFYRQYGEYDSYGITASGILKLGPADMIARLVEDALKAVGSAGLEAWTAPFNLLINPLTITSNLLTLALMAVVVALMVVFLLKFEADKPDEARLAHTGMSWPVQAIILGIAGILMGRLPSWVAGLPLRIEFSWDRFMLSMMLGGSLFFVGLLEFFIKNGRRKTVLASLFIALAVGQQFTAANAFRRDWANQQAFFWQLAWRIPALKEDTLLVTHELPLQYESDYNLSGALNWIYAPDTPAEKLPYMFAYTKARLGSSLLPSLQPNQPAKAIYRTVDFNGSTSNMIVFYYPVPGCLRVLNPEYDSKETLPGMTYMLTDAVPLSNLSRIIPDASEPQMPKHLFGQEPEHTWCYYYQKADSARQTGDWQAAASLGDEALEKGYSAILPAEWLPFIEAYAVTGSYQAAVDLTVKTVEGDGELAPALCSLWQRVETQHAVPAEYSGTILELRTTLSCSP